MGPVIGPVHDRLVGPLEVERQNERLAQALVLELLAPGVEEPALRAGRRVVGQHVALDAAVADRRKVVARGPDTRGEFLPEQIVAPGEAFERHVPVAVKFVAQRVEIVLADGDRQSCAPPVLDAVVFDEAAGLEFPDLVGTRSQRGLQRGFLERTLRIIGTRKDRQ
jgi:hypothetical protein